MRDDISTLLIQMVGDLTLTQRLDATQVEPVDIIWCCLTELNLRTFDHRSLL